VVGTNVWVAGFELDVIASRGRTLAFCEVKSKTGTAFGDPLEMITPQKVRRVRRAAEAWLAWHPAYSEHMVRYDAIVVRGSRLECLRGAF
jgi:putative endonuclease